MQDAATNVALAVVKSPAAHGYWWRQLLAILVESLRLVQYVSRPLIKLTAGSDGHDDRATALD